MSKFKPEILYEKVSVNEEDKQIILSSSKTCKISDLKGRAFRAPWTVTNENNENAIMLCVSNNEPLITQTMKCETIRFLYNHISVDQPNNEGMIPIIQATIMQEELVVNCSLELMPM